MQKPSSTEEAREWLCAVAKFLSKVPNASSRTRFAATAINEYLSGAHKSLDHAFGLKAGRGRPKTDLSQGKYFDAAYKAFEMEVDDKS